MGGPSPAAALRSLEAMGLVPDRAIQLPLGAEPRPRCGEALAALARLQGAAAVAEPLDGIAHHVARALFWWRHGMVEQPAMATCTR